MSSSADGSNDKPQHNAAIHPFDTPNSEVPPGFRTARLAPRITALILVAAWVLTFQVGTSALAVKQAKSTVPLDELFSERPLSWGLFRDAQGKKECLGTLSTELVTTPKIVASVRGAAHLGRASIGTPLTLNVTATFDGHNTLSTLSGRATLAGLEASLEETEANSRRVVLSISNDELSEQMVFNRPHPVVLVRRAGGRYGLKFPQALDSFLTLFRSKLKEQIGHTSYEIARLEDNEKTICERAMSSSRNSHQQEPLLEKALLGVFRSLRSPTSNAAP